MNSDLGPVVTYIRNQQQQGIANEEIRRALIAHNWDPLLVEQAFSQLGPEETSTKEPQQPVMADATPLQSTSQPAPTGVIASQPSETQAIAPQKYRVLQAAKDAFAAIRNNALAYGLSAVVVVALQVLMTIAAAVAAVVIAGLTFASGSSGAVSSGVVFIVVSIVGGLLVAAVTVALSAIALTPMVLAVDEGAEGRKSTAAELLRISFRKLKRVSLAILLFGFVIAWPLFAVPALMALLLTINFVSGADIGSGAWGILTLLMPLLMIPALIYMIILYFRYALVTTVAILEPDLPLKKTLKRSSYLLAGGGQWFLVKSVLLVGFVSLFVAVLTGDLSKSANEDASIASNIVSIALSLLFGAVTVMLYRNRRAVKDGTVVRATAPSDSTVAGNQLATTELAQKL